jgi:hypothetical protein
MLQDKLRIEQREHILLSNLAVVQQQCMVILTIIVVNSRDDADTCKGSNVLQSSQ